MSLTLSFLPRGDAIVVRIHGRMDAFGTSTAESTLGSRPLDNTKRLILDCAEMSYLSSAGVRLIISLQKRLSASNQELALCSLQPFCHGVLEMSGLTGLIPIYASVTEALAPAQDNSFQLDSPVGRFTFQHLDSSTGTIDILGDIANILDCSVTADSITGKPFFETEYSLGAGSMGGTPEDYLPVIGEAIMVAGTLVWLPTDGHDTPDYMIPRKASTKVMLQTAFNASIRGGFNDFIHFTAPIDQPATIRDIYRTLFETAKQRHPNDLGVIGLAMRAEIADAYGAGITRSPLLSNRPSNGLPITAPENFADWFESDKTPRNQNTTALICGAGADLTRDLGGIDQDRLRRMFYVNPANAGQQTESLHNHAVFFSDAPELLDQRDMDVEMRHVVDHGRFVDMRHLLDQTTIRSAVIAVSYIQEVREDRLR
jgi:anti-anti-sigma factor